jgi:uncharacterized protein
MARQFWIWNFAAGAVLLGCQQPQAEPSPTPAATATPAPKVDEATKGTAPAAPTKPQRNSAKRLYDLSILKTITLDMNGHPTRLWVMDDAGKRAEGLMWLDNQDIKRDQGAIFVFDQPGARGFWMQNTLIPLDIIYFDEKGKLLNVAHGKALDDQHTLPSKGPSQFVIELKSGEAARLGLHPGSKIEIPKTLVGS